jgi:hypothetical protein
MKAIIVGYSLYVNGNHYSIYETLQDAWKQANRYHRWNSIDVLPMIRFYQKDNQC